MIYIRNSAFFFAVCLIACGTAGQSAFADPAKLALGKQIFLEVAEPKCGVCHVLADAGVVGEIGPSLDDLRPDAERVEAAVVNGVGVMPAFEGLTPDQIDALAFYVSTVAGKAQ